MAYLACDHETPKRTGIRIRAPGRYNTHPAYSHTKEYYCQVCGERLRQIGVREFNDIMNAGARTGA
jgi:hypothetical protein